MFRRPHYIALGLVGILTLMVLNLPHHAASQLKLAIGSLFLPLFGLSKSSQQFAREAGNALLPRPELLKQIEELRHTAQQLQIHSMQAEAILSENDRLRQLLGWKKQRLWNLKLATVIARDPANWWQTVEIDLGKGDQMQTNLPIITSAGLVGRISAVWPASSEVTLIGNPNCRVSAVVESEGARESGVIAGGASPLDNTLATLSYLSSTSNLKPGQKVITSGWGRVFPKGITIGQIAEDSRPVDFGLYTEARVKLAANLNALEEVWVVMP